MASTPAERDADRLARSVLRDRLGLRPKENVTIECYPTALPWAAGFVREARRMGAFPVIHYEDENAYWDAAENGRSQVVGTLAAHERALLADTDVYIYFWGPEDLARRDRLPPKAVDQLVAFNDRWYEVAGKAGLRGARMAIARATDANARRYGVSGDGWRRQLFESSVGRPSTIEALARKVGRHLAGRGELRLTHPNGTDLTLRLAGRPVQYATGVLPPPKKRGTFGFMVNVPDGSTYTTVDESVAEGTVIANRPTTTSGPTYEGGRWSLRGGRLTSHRYRAGNKEFETAFRAGTGAKDRIAMVEVGLDSALDGVPLMEENERGAVSVFIGNNRGSGGKNVSSFATYLTVAGGDLTIGGRPVVRRGKIV